MSAPLQGPIPGAPHFTWQEMIRSQTAAQYKLDNHPGPQTQKRLAHLARTILEPIRRQFGPIQVLSGFRSGELNWYVSLSRTSRHCRGEAADIRPLNQGVSLTEVAGFIIRELPFQELIAYPPAPGWLHVSCRMDGLPAGKTMLQAPGRPLQRLSPDSLLQRLAQEPGLG